MKTSLLCLMLSSLFGCASSGLYVMSDYWCEAHPAASQYRCPDRTLRNADTYCQYGEHPGDAKCFNWSQEALKKDDSRQGCADKGGEALEIDGLYVECY